MLCIHHNDADGIGSAACVFKYAGFKKSESEFYCFNYSGDLPDDVLKRHQSEKLFIVDLNFNDKNWKKILNLFNTNNIVWIDHHLDQSDLQEDTRKIIDKLKGIRKIGKSAIFLSYHYFNFIESFIPAPILLINEWDTWDWKKNNTVNAKFFNLGLKIRSNDPTSDFWQNEILTDDINKQNQICRQIISDGKIIDKFQKENSKKLKNNIHYEILYNRTVACINYGGNLSSEYFPPCKTDIKCVYAFNGKNWTYSFYSNDDTDIDVKSVVDKLMRDKLFISGGGHRNAAGGISDKNIFMD